MRRLDRIEKEVGYCEVKLEKERRLRCQKLYLQAEVEALDEVLGSYAPAAVESQLKYNRLAGVAMSEVPRILRQGTKEERQAVRRDFLSLATYVALREEREVLGNELEALVQRLAAYEGFATRRSRLLEQRRQTLEGLGIREGDGGSSLLEEFQKTEARWNALSEDCANLEEAGSHVERNLDYLRSARNFLLAARATFDIDEWRRSGCFSDLFKHSAVGRAFEMVQGADLNAKLAEKELLCLQARKFQHTSIERVLVPFMQALFEDLFVLSSFQNTKAVLEEAEKANRRHYEELVAFQKKVEEERDQLEAEREQKFAEMGEEVKRIAYQ